MPVYKWEGTSKQGVELRGESEAVNEGALRDLLRRKNIRLKAIKEKRKDIFSVLRQHDPFRRNLGPARRRAYVSRRPDGKGF